MNRRITRAKTYISHAERLNPEDHFRNLTEMVCDSPIHDYKKNRGEGNNKALRLAIGHKSNRMVLNAKTARLAQCLAETEDQLIRDMLEATAGLLNCTGGTNGSDVAILKSALIDLDISAGNAGDDRAQATVRCAA